MEQQDGRLVCRLSELIAIAQVTWENPTSGSGARWLSYSVIAEITDLDRKTISAWASDTVNRLHLPVLGKLCVFFGVSSGTLLAYLPPGQTHQRLDFRTLPRSQLPDRLPPVTVTSHLVARLLGYLQAELSDVPPEQFTALAARRLGMSYQGATKLLYPDEPPTVIERSTLVRACDLLRIPSLDDLFTVSAVPEQSP